MPFRKTLLRSVLITTIIVLTAIPQGIAGIAGQKLGACPERLYLTNSQIHVAAAIATVGDPVANRISLRNRDQTIIDGILVCARDIRRNVCNDKLLMGIMDPGGALVGGVAGLGWDFRNRGPSVIGGLLGAGVAGMATGMVSLAQCNQRLELIRPAAVTTFGGWRIDVSNVHKSEIRERLVQAARSRAISTDDATLLWKFVTEVGERLSE